MANKLWSLLKPTLSRKSVVWVLLIVGVGSAAFASERVKEQFPFLIAAELRFHQILYWLSLRGQEVKLVRVVALNDYTHWVTLAGESPTDRKFLASLITHAVTGPKRAAVIALDVQLKALPGFPPGTDSLKRGADNAALLEAIHTAASAGVPVILTEGLVPNAAAQWQRQANIFRDADLPLGDSNGPCKPGPCVVLGYINLPHDHRLIPLRSSALSWDGSPGPKADSFALAAVTAYETKTTRELTVQKPLIASSLAGGKFVYGGFIPPKKFPRVEPEALARGDPEAMHNCDACILVIGGDWKTLQGKGPLTDGYLSPVGVISGMFLHANYIEALLDGRYHRAVPFGIAFGFDALFAILLYIVHQEITGSAAKWWVLGIFMGLLLVVYVLFTNLNFYMEFIVPLGLCFAHLVYDHVFS